MHVELFSEFVVLAEELNFHSAAKRLNLAQSTLSKHIAALEREYGVPLFKRDRFGVSLTSAGTVLLESARAIAAEFERSKGLFAPSGTCKTLFIGGELDNPSSFNLVSDAVARFMQHGHGFTPHFVAGTSMALESQVASLRSGETDCAVFAFDLRELARRPDASDFAYRLVCDEPIDALMAPTHPLAHRNRLTRSDLAGCTLIRLVGPRYSTGWKLLERQLASAGIPHQSRPFAANSPYDFINMNLGDAIVLLPRMTARGGAAARNGAALVPFEPGELRLSMHALYLRAHHLPAIDAFIDALVDACARELTDTDADPQ